MHLPHFIGVVNKHVSNRVLGLLAGRIGAFAWIEHVGRTSGKRYRTPIAAYPHEDGFVIALTYGSRTDWVRNVMATGEATLTWRHARYRIVNPTLVQGSPVTYSFGPLSKPLLRLIGINNFLIVQKESAQES